VTAYSPVVKEGLQQALPAQYTHFILFLRTSFLLKLEILCAFYRRPSHTCKYVYACVCMCAQAFRHLYVLAAQPRCVEARDVDSKQLVYVPLGVTTCAQEVCMRVYGCVLCMPCMHCDVGLKQLLFLYHKEGLFLYHKGGLFLYHKGGLLLYHKRRVGFVSQRRVVFVFVSQRRLVFVPQRRAMFRVGGWPKPY